MVCCSLADEAQTQASAIFLSFFSPHCFKNNNTVTVTITLNEAILGKRDIILQGEIMKKEFESLPSHPLAVDSFRLHYLKPLRNGSFRNFNLN